MMNATFTLNDELNGIEISFESKPEAAILASLKGAGYRWHRVKKVWYAKQTADRLALAEQIATGAAGAADPVNVKADSKAENKIDLSGLEGYEKNAYGADFAKVVREELKRRGVKGVTVRSQRSGWTDSITVTIQLLSDDFRSVEEAAERFSNAELWHRFGRSVYYNDRWHNVDELDGLTEEQLKAVKMDYVRNCFYKIDGFSRYDITPESYPQLTAAAIERVQSIYKIANAWNWNNSDSMSDYFDVGYYLDLDAKMPKDFVPVENMTDNEKKTLEMERIAEEERREAEYQKMLAEQEAARIASEERERITREQIAEIEEHVTVKDLDESEQLYITDLAQGAGKECSVDELRESIERHPNSREDALIDRIITFTDERIYSNFANLLLADWSFLENKGGTGSEDVRLDGIDKIWNLDTEQRESIKWFACHSVAVYLNGDLMLVCNPEGFSYSRYTYIPDDLTKIEAAAPILFEQEQESREKEPFYNPAPVTEQIEQIKTDADVTIYQTDGFGMVCPVSGHVRMVTAGKWAQHEGFYITLSVRRKDTSIFIRDDKPCLIFSGILPNIPEFIRYYGASHSGGIMTASVREGRDLLKELVKYYSGQNVKPLLDTVKR